MKNKATDAQKLLEYPQKFVYLFLASYDIGAVYLIRYHADYSNAYSLLVI